MSGFRILIVDLAKFMVGVFVVAVGLLALSLYSLSNRDVEVKHLSELNSPDGACSLNIDVAYPSVPYGPYTVRASVNDTLNKIVVTGNSAYRTTVRLSMARTSGRDGLMRTPWRSV